MLPIVPSADGNGGGGSSLQRFVMGRKIKQSGPRARLAPAVLSLANCRGGHFAKAAPHASDPAENGVYLIDAYSLE